MILTCVHLICRQHVVLFSHFLNLFSDDCFYDLFNSIEQDYWFSEAQINVKVLFYFVQNYCSDFVKMLEIINQLSVYLYKSCSCFCEWFSHYLEKSIENFIYVRSTELFLLVHDVQNVIFNHLWKWFYCLFIFKAVYVA